MRNRETDSFYWEFQGEGKSVNQPLSPPRLSGPLIEAGELVNLTTLTIEGGGTAFILGAASRGDWEGIAGGLTLVGAAEFVRRLKG